MIIRVIIQIKSSERAELWEEKKVLLGREQTEVIATSRNGKNTKSDKEEKN